MRLAGESIEENGEVRILGNQLRELSFFVKKRVENQAKPSKIAPKGAGTQHFRNIFAHFRTIFASFSHHFRTIRTASHRRRQTRQSIRDLGRGRKRLLSKLRFQSNSRRIPRFLTENTRFWRSRFWHTIMILPVVLVTRTVYELNTILNGAVHVQDRVEWCDARLTSL